MSGVCFFNEQASDILQHVAVGLEMLAIYLVYRDYKMFGADIGRQWRVSVSPSGKAWPKKSRVPQFRSALIVGVIAVMFEF